MLPTLISRASGSVLAANPAAASLLGSCEGHDCWNVVLGVSPSRRPVCRPGCTAALGLEKTRERARPVRVRGKPYRLACRAVGDYVVVELAASDPVPKAQIALSAREREVLALLGEGLLAPAVARYLGIAVTTVRTHIAKLRRKLGVHSQAAAVARALGTGEIDTGSAARIPPADPSIGGPDALRPRSIGG